MCTGAPRPAQRGWTLLALIVLLAVALLIIVGVSLAVAAGWRVTLVRAHQARAWYLAHAGVMDAIAGYRPGTTVDDEFDLGCFGNDPACDNSLLNLGPGEVFIRADGTPQRDVLLVDMSNQGTQTPVITRRTSQSTFDNWELRRISANKDLTVRALQVRWTGAVSTERVRRVCLNANWNVVGWGASGGCFAANVTAGTTIPLPNPNFTLSNNNWVSNNHVLFNIKLDVRIPLVVVVTLLMSDDADCIPDIAAGCAPPDGPLPNAPTLADLGSLRQAQVTENYRRTAVWVVRSAIDPANDENWGLWTARATGEYRADGVSAARGLRAEYRAHASSAGQQSQIIAWQEQQPPLR